MSFSVFPPICSALKKLGKIAKRYGKTTDEKLQEEVAKTIFQSKVTLIECHLVNALVTSETDPEEAAERINEQVKGFPDAGVLPMKHLHKSVWKHAQMVMRGNPIQYA